MVISRFPKQPFWGFNLKYKNCIPIDLGVENMEFNWRIYYVPLRKINFNGVTLATLENLKTYIEMSYGKNWMIPISQKTFSQLLSRFLEISKNLWTKNKNDKNIGKIINGKIKLYNYSKNDLDDNINYKLRTDIF